MIQSGLTGDPDSILGTPSYMAPEQAEGKVKQVGPARRRLCPGRDPVRAARRPAAVPGRDGARDARAGQDGRAGAALAAGAWPGARRRGHRTEVPAEGPGQALRIGHRAGRRPAPVPGGRADPWPDRSGRSNAPGDGAGVTRPGPSRPEPWRSRSRPSWRLPSRTPTASTTSRSSRPRRRIGSPGSRPTSRPSGETWLSR